MKILHETDYRIQSVNRHLKNILEENYYIELGCINYKILTRLLEGEEIEDYSDVNKIYKEQKSVNIDEEDLEG